MTNYVVDFETETRYVTRFFECFEAARAYFDVHRFNWDYGSLRQRTMDPITLADVYTDIMLHGNE